MKTYMYFVIETHRIHYACLVTLDFRKPNFYAQWCVIEQGRAGRPGQARPGQGRAGQGRAGQGRAGQTV